MLIQILYQARFLGVIISDTLYPGNTRYGTLDAGIPRPLRRGLAASSQTLSEPYPRMRNPSNKRA